MSAELQVLEEFAPLLGQDFILPGDGGEHPAIAFKLVEANKLSHGHPGQKRPPFQLIFRVATQDVFEQGNYMLSHPDLGERLVFLVPNARSAEGVDYCATFN